MTLSTHMTLKDFRDSTRPSVVWNDPGFRAPIRGPRSVRKRLEVFAAAFPDLRWKLSRIFAQDEQVCAEFTFMGTHKGPLPENNGKGVIAPTNKRVRIQACGVYTVKNGKIPDSRIYFDFGNIRRPNENGKGVGSKSPLLGER